MGKWRGGKGRAPQVTVEPGPLRALLRHCECTLSSTTHTADITSANEVIGVYLFVCRIMKKNYSQFSKNSVERRGR